MGYYPKTNCILINQQQLHHQTIHIPVYPESFYQIYFQVNAYQDYTKIFIFLRNIFYFDHCYYFPVFVDKAIVKDIFILSRSTYLVYNL